MYYKKNKCIEYPAPDPECVSKLEFLRRCYYLHTYEKGVGSRFHDVFEVDKAFNELNNQFGALQVKSCERLLNCKHARRKRLYGRIDKILSFSPAYFVTFTFDDSSFDKLNPKSRRQKVAEALKKSFGFYVANIDFGEVGEREHYHAVCSCSLSRLIFPYGRSEVKVIGSGEQDPVRVKRYIAKLVNHALKYDDLQFKAIFSRGVPEPSIYFKLSETEVDIPFVLR